MFTMAFIQNTQNCMIVTWCSLYFTCRCYGVAKTLRGLHTDINPGIVLSSLSYNHQVCMLVGNVLVRCV